MYKIIGIFFVFFSCSACGFFISHMLYTSVRQLDAFCRLVKFIETQIDYYLTPLDRIFLEYEDKHLELCGFLPLTRNVGAVKALDECKNKLYLSSVQYKELKSFFSSLGTHSSNEEKKHCEYFYTRLRELLSEAEEVLAARERLSRSLGILAGIFLALILI